MTYKQAIMMQCEEYAKDPVTRFIGYNTTYGSRMYGTLANIPLRQCIETPIQENLMLGMGIGMSLEGYRPVVCFERHDFLLLALDALVNHLDKMSWISGDQFTCPVIVRAIVGSSKPLNPGAQHTQDYTKALMTMLKNTPVYEPKSTRELNKAWSSVDNTESGGVVIVEHRDWYEQEIPNK